MDGAAKDKRPAAGSRSRGQNNDHGYGTTVAWPSGPAADGHPGAAVPGLGTGPGSSAACYNQLESDISRALAASQQTFRSGANTGAGAFGPLEAVVIAASLLIAASSAWGLSRRIA